MAQINADKVIQRLASKIGVLEAENAVLQAQLEEESNDSKDSPQS